MEVVEIGGGYETGAELVSVPVVHGLSDTFHFSAQCSVPRGAGLWN